MKIKTLFVIICLLSILLSACGKGAPEAGSQPGTSTQGTTAQPSAVIDPPTQGTEPPAPINQEVTPKSSYDGPINYNFDCEYVDTENATYVRVDWDSIVLQPIESLDRVYYSGYIPSVLEEPDDTYYMVVITTYPMVCSMYGRPDGSDDAELIYQNTTAELRRRLEEAGYPILKDYEHDESITACRIITIMSVEEMKALNCGDDMSINIGAYTHSQHL